MGLISQQFKAKAKRPTIREECGAIFGNYILNFLKLIPNLCRE